MEFYKQQSNGVFESSVLDFTFLVHIVCVCVSLFVCKLEPCTVSMVTKHVTNILCTF